MSKYVKGSQFRNMADFANYMGNNTALYFHGKIINVAFVQNWQYRFISSRLHLLKKAIKVSSFKDAKKYTCIDDFQEALTIGKKYYLWEDGRYYGYVDDNGKEQYLTKMMFNLYFKEA
jgi:hypothetical protein